MFEFNEEQLWKERISQTSREYIQYLKYILNGHLALVLVFLVGAGAYYYQQWLQGIPADFPVAFIMMAILTIAVTNSPISTMLKDADRIFLIAVETKLKKYFAKCILTSFVLQGYILLLLLAVLMPLYAKVHEGDFKRFWYFLMVLLIAKGANLLIRWHIQYIVNQHYHRMDTVLRFIVNAVLLYLLFSDAPIYFILAIFIILSGLLLYYQKVTRFKGLKWEYLIEQDEKRLASFYRFANMFTDVPKLRNQIKRRRFVDIVLNRIPYSGNDVYRHLYWRTFVRAGDYFGLVIRLTVICGLIVFFLSYGVGQLIFVVLFLFITGLQLIPLWQAYDNKLWVTIYPVDGKFRKKSFKELITIILSIQSVVLFFILIIKGEWINGFLSLALAGGMILFFVYVYLNKKLNV